MKLEIRTYGDPILRQKAWPVEKVTREIRELAADMIETMHEANGVGLAAQQVGRLESVFVIDIPEEYDVDEAGQRLHPDVTMPMVFINPVITEASPITDSCDEGCLSFPDMSVPVKRSVEIMVKFMDLKGTPRTMRLKLFLARAAQHEMDHLNAVLLVDHMSSIKKIALAGQLKRLKKSTQENLAQKV